MGWGSQGRTRPRPRPSHLTLDPSSLGSSTRVSTGKFRKSKSWHHSKTPLVARAACPSARLFLGSLLPTW